MLIGKAYIFFILYKFGVVEEKGGYELFKKEESELSTKIKNLEYLICQTLISSKINIKKTTKIEGEDKKFFDLYINYPEGTIAQDYDNKCLKFLKEAEKGQLEQNFLENIDEKTLTNFYYLLGKAYHKQDVLLSRNKGCSKFGEPVLLEPENKKNNGVGIILCHGFAGTPEQMRPLGEHLRDLGYTLYLIRMEGHGTTVDDMASTKWVDWYNSYERGVLSLDQLTDKIFVGGASTGGLLAIHSAADAEYHEDIDGVVNMQQNVKGIGGLISIDTPLVLVNFLAYFAPYIQKKIKYFSFGSKKSKQLKIAYEKVPLESVVELVKLIRRVKRKDLPKIKNKSTLVMHSRFDFTAWLGSAKMIFNLVQSSIKQVSYLHGGHMSIMNDETAYQTALRIDTFIKETLKTP